MSATGGEAHERYAACDYAGVVALLRDLPRAELLTDPAQAVLLASSARHVGGVDDLLELLEATADAARGRHPAALCEALNLQGVLLFERGRVAAAERTWCDLVEVATMADDAQFVARASNNLGVTAVLSMRLDNAIQSFRRAVSAYLRLSFARGLAQSHTNLGIVFREMDHEQEAFSNFERALTWAHTAESPEEAARAYEELALYHLYVCQDARNAHATAQDALERFTELGEARGIGHASRVAGVVALAEGQNAVADELLNRALAIAREHKIQLLEGETLLALAVLALRHDARPLRFTLREQARAVFAELAAEPWGAQVALRMEQIATW